MNELTNSCPCGDELFINVKRTTTIGMLAKSVNTGHGISRRANCLLCVEFHLGTCLAKWAILRFYFTNPNGQSVQMWFRNRQSKCDGDPMVNESAITVLAKQVLGESQNHTIST